MDSITVTLYYKEGSEVKKVVGKHLHSDDITTEFDVRFDDEIVHILYSHSKSKVFEYNPGFNEDDPTSYEYVPFRHPVVRIKIERLLQPDTGSAECVVITE